jgi:maleylacetate reductase
MESFTFEPLPGRIIFGAGCRRKVSDEVERLQVKRVLLIVDPHDVKQAEEIAGYLGDSCVAVFSAVAQHVPVGEAAQARELASEVGAEATVSFGGGSATGFGKAISLSHHLPQICIPTTYAGSELTPIWGLTNGSHKQTGRDLAVLPRTVLYDPELTLALPIAIAGPSGMNALAHAVEGMYAPGANPVTSVVALEAVRVLVEHLPRLVLDPLNLAERSDVLYGAYLAGTVLAVAGTSLHHKMCHVLGGAYGLDHGQMNAVILPHALHFNAPAVLQVYDRLSEVLGGDAAGKIYDLATALGSPQDLRSIGYPEGDIAVTAALIAKSAEGNVRSIDEVLAAELLRECIIGERPS